MNCFCGKNIIYFILLWIFSSCSLQKQLSEDQILLHQIKIKNAPKGHNDKLKSLIKEKPKKGFIRYQSIAYYLKMQKKKESRTNKFFQNLFGTKPVFLDTSRMKELKSNMLDYLMNQGYFLAKIQDTISVKRKKATVIFNISPDEVFTIRKFAYFVPDKRINELVNETINNSFIVEGENYSSTNLINERQRIKNNMTNKGYYKFNENYIIFEVDTGMSDKHQVDIAVVLRNYSDTQAHVCYSIRDIYYEPNYKFQDTSVRSMVLYDGFTFVGPYDNIKPEMLIRYTDIKKNAPYRSNDVRQTLNQFSEFQIYKFIDIGFEEIATTQADSQNLDCKIRLTPMKLQELTTEFEANTTEEDRQITSSYNRYFGMAGNIKYKNRNVFKRAIQWTVKFGGAFNASINSKDQGSYEFEVMTGLSFPQAFLPKSILQKRISQTSRTSLSLSYFYEDNADFGRNTTNLSYSYQFNNEFVKHYVTLVEFSLIQTRLQESFKEKLDELDDPLISSLFDPHLLSLTRYSLLYHDKGLRKNHFWKIRWTLESAGNLLYTFNRITSGKNPDNAQKYKFAGVDFFQYIRTEFDVSYNQRLSFWSDLVLRCDLGIGSPYGNSSLLPYEKRFFAGGANSIRAWGIHELGPGSFSDTSGLQWVDQSGEIKIETNIEYRFDMFSFFKGALFVDAGNVWTQKEDERRPGSGIDLKNIFDEFAIGAGYGIRMDFSFLIFRLDFALPLRDPVQIDGKRWVIENFTQRNWVSDNIRINVGLGYPF